MSFHDEPPLYPLPTQNLSLDELARQLSSSDWDQCADAAADPRLTEEQLAPLLSHPCSAVRQGVAANLATPQHMLVTLSADPDKAVREALAGNSGAAPELLTGLAHDPSGGDVIHCELCNNDSTPLEALRVIAHARNYVGFLAVQLWQHPNADEELRSRLVQAGDPQVLEQAYQRLVRGGRNSVHKDEGVGQSRKPAASQDEPSVSQASIDAVLAELRQLRIQVDELSRRAPVIYIRVPERPATTARGAFTTKRRGVPLSMDPYQGRSKRS